METWLGGRQSTLLVVQSNYQCHRRHTLPQREQTSRLRIVVTVTNSDLAAAILKIHRYSESLREAVIAR